MQMIHLFANQALNDTEIINIIKMVINVFMRGSEVFFSPG